MFSKYIYIVKTMTYCLVVRVNCLQGDWEVRWFLLPISTVQAVDFDAAGGIIVRQAKRSMIQKICNVRSGPFSYSLRSGT